MQEFLRILMQMVSNPVSAFTMLLILFISVIWVVHWLTKKFTRIDMTQQHFKQSLEVLTESVREVKTEIVNLSAKMDDRFDKVDKRFVRLETEMNDRFAKVDKRFVRLETEMNDRFAKVDEHFVRLETEMNDRFDKMEAKMDGRINKLDAKTDEHFVRLETEMNDRFDKLETKMDGRINKLDAKMDEHFERVEMRIERVETTLAATREDVASLKTIAKVAMRTGVPVRHLSQDFVEMEMVE